MINLILRLKITEITCIHIQVYRIEKICKTTAYILRFVRWVGNFFVIIIYLKEYNVYIKGMCENVLRCAYTYILNFTYSMIVGFFIFRISVITTLPALYGFRIQKIFVRHTRSY